MWVYIKKENLDKYISQYPELEENINAITLMSAKDSLFLPRLFMNNFPSQFLVNHPGKKAVIPNSVNFKFTKELRPSQKPAVAQILKKFKTNGFVNGICKAYPGFGKTVITTYIAAQMGLRTCIIVDNSELMRQWIESFITFTDLTVDDIGIIQQKLFVIDKPVTIAMTQSLLSKLKNNFNKTFKTIDDAGIGLLFYDEVHCTSSSEKFAKVSILFRTRNVIGLSATPFQSGLSEILMHNTIGDIIYETKDYDLTPKYYFVYYDSELAEQPSGWKRKKDGKDINIYTRLGRIQDYVRRKSYYNSVITKSQRYLNIIRNYTSNLVKNDYKVMIMCMTKKQVTEISDSLTQFGVVNRRFYGDERDIDKINDKVIVVTYSFCGKGFDFQSLSALIFACPLSGKKSVIQVLGRILRFAENKKQPIVIDLIDEAFPLMFMPEVRRKKGIVTNEFDNCKIIEYRELNL